MNQIVLPYPEEVVGKPRMFIPPGAQRELEARGWKRVPRKVNRRMLALRLPQHEGKEFAEKPTALYVEPSNPNQRPIFLIGMGEVYGEELADLAQRVLEKQAATAVETEQRAKEHRAAWWDAVRDAFERRVARHKANPVTDPAPNYTRNLKGYFNGF